MQSMVSTVVSCPTNSLGTKEASAALQASGGDRGFLALGCWSFGLLFGSGYLLGRLRLNEAVQMAALRSSGCRLLQWLLASATVVSKYVCLSGRELSGSSRSQSFVLTLASFSAEQSPGSCNVPASISLYLSPFCVYL